MNIPEIVYHGTNEEFEYFQYEPAYFSSKKSFAKDYGKIIKECKVLLNNPFNTSLKEDVNKVFNVLGYLEDGYDNKRYYTFEEYYNSSNYESDTWEIFEREIGYIKGLGYDGMIIYEGGVENYVVFDSAKIVSL